MLEVNVPVHRVNALIVEDKPHERGVDGYEGSAILGISVQTDEFAACG